MSAPSLQKLTKRAQFLHVRGGVRVARGAVLVEARRQAEAGPIRVGFTASRKVGGAVERNRAKRRLREAARQLLPELGVAGVDYVLVARQSTPGADWARLLDDLRGALIRLRADLTSAGGHRSPQPRDAIPRSSAKKSD